jgi:folate-binding protein YgfZ
MLITELPDFDYLQVSGPDSVKFLQGQLTCNVERLTASLSLPGAVCNLKGRVIADFTLFKDGENYLLQCTAGSGSKLQQTLARYAVFSKVELALAQSPARVCGVIGNGARAAFAELALEFPDGDYAVSDSTEYRIHRLPGRVPRYQLWCKTSDAAARLRQLDVMEELTCSAAWLREEIYGGIVHVDAGMSEEYTPQLLNYDLSGVIDFKKGCYTGQEVVARMFYRGKPKKRLYLIACGEDLETGTVISSSSSPEQPAAEILSAVPRHGEEPSVALAILPTALTEAEPASLVTETKISVQILPMPYTE